MLEKSIFLSSDVKEEIKSAARSRYTNIATMCLEHNISYVVVMNHIRRGLFSKEIAEKIALALPNIDKDKIMPVKIDPVEIKRTREKLNLSQENFGKLFGVSAKTICFWEHGKNLPINRNCFRFFKAFNRIKHEIPANVRKITPVKIDPVKIKRTRKKLNLSQENFGKLFGVSRITVYYWENGKQCLISRHYPRFFEACNQIKQQTLVDLQTEKERKQIKQQTLVDFRTEKESEEDLFFKTELNAKIRMALKKVIQNKFGTQVKMIGELGMNTGFLQQFPKGRISLHNATKIANAIDGFNVLDLALSHKKGSDIRKMREGSDVSIQDAADALGISLAKYCKYEDNELTNVTERMMNIFKSLFKRKTKKLKSYPSNSKTSIKWNKAAQRVQIAFKPADIDYFKKWKKVSGSTNIDKIKTLLDKEYKE